MSTLLKHALVLGLCTVIWTIQGCGPGEALETGEAEADAQSEKLKVTCTIGMITDLVRTIGGDHVQVTGLMGPGVDPHLYKATQGDLAKLTDADLIFYNGLHLEGRMADVLVRMASRIETVQVTETIPVELLREPPEFNGNYDPHVWFDVSLWRYAAEHIRDVLLRRMPAQEQDFTANAAALLQTLDELHAYAKERIGSLPDESRLLLTAHDAFGYFGRAYGLEVMGIQGISTAAEYGLQDLDRLITLLVQRKVKAVFVESSVSSRSIEALIAGVQAKGHAVRLGGSLFSDAMGDDGTPEGTYPGMVRHNVDTIVEALR